MLTQDSIHSLHRPALSDMRPHVLERRTLLQRVFAEPAARIVLAQGPAGHGKTTFLYQAEAACRAQGIATRWLNLRASRHELTSLLARWQGQLDVPQAILLDDLHHVADREVMNQLQALLERAPAGVRWFLASRTVPALDLAGLQVASELLWLQAADLRWRLQDTEALLNGVGQLVLDARTVAWLHRHTDGWPAPLQLYRQALQSHSSRGPLGANLPLHLPSLNSYLHAAVLGAQPADRRTFLLRCAVLGRWSASSCNAILGRSDAAQTLAQLAQDGLVQRMPADADSYVLPPVLVAFLRRRLRDAQPEQLVSAHLAAAGWHEQQGLLAEAVHHYIEGGDEPQACEVFNTWLEHLITAGNFSQALAVAERLPLQRIEQHPALCLKLCWVYALAGQHERLAALRPALQRLSRACSPLADPDIFLSVSAELSEDTRVARLDLPQAPLHADGSLGLFELCMAADVQAGAAMTQGDCAQELGRSATEPLTKKERIVLALLVKCMSNSQIADAMFVSRETVKFHLKNIYAKLGVSSRLELIRAAATLSIV